jgi:peptide deformylase
MQLDSINLYQTCSPPDFARSLANLRLAQRMIQTMIRENGIGLAANQVGENVRLFVMYVDGEFFHCFDPSIQSHSDTVITSREGCLSFPGEYCQVTRWESIQARFANASGHYQTRELSGLAARCFQHELDHLNGITMLSRAQDDSQQRLHLVSQNQ